MRYVVYHNPENRHHGMGHQLKTVWSIFTLAEEFGLEPLYSELYGKEKPWVENLNYNYGLKKLEEIGEHKSIEILEGRYGGNSYDFYRDIIETNKEDNVVFKIGVNTRYMLYQMTNQIKIENVRNRFRSCYYKYKEKKPISLSFDNSKINVSVHVRRGDVSNNKGGVIGRRFVKEEYFNKTMKNVNKLGDVKFYVYSDNKLRKDVFDKNLDIEFKLKFNNRNPQSEFILFHEMLNSDILIGSPSNWTYILGELMEGSVLYLDRMMPHPKGEYSVTPFSDGVKRIKVEENGEFDFDKLKEYVKRF